MSGAAALSLIGVSRRYGQHLAVDDVALEVAAGELIVLLGPSGCGKTTTLRMIAGFVPPTAGDIRLDGEDITNVPAHRRDMGIVFQSYALFPHLSVARNVAFGLEMRRMPSAAIQARVEEMLRLVKLEALRTRLPRQLSGGQQQRVALARALAIHPRVLLLDEPLSNLDAGLRAEMAREIRILQRDRGITTIMVTHDQTEAMAMADRLVVMREGRVQQIGTPEQVHASPANPFVARFIGGSNVLGGRLEAGRLTLPDGAVVLPAERYRAEGDATLTVRPDSVRLEEPGNAVARAHGEVTLCTYLGTVIEHVVRIGPGTEILARGPGIGPAARRRPAGARVALTWSPEEERVFDAAGQAAAPIAARDTSKSRETNDA